MKINTDAATRLKNLRLAAGYQSAKEFADNFSVTEVTYRAHENGNRNISIRAARKYAALLNTTYSYILDGKIDLKDADIAVIDAIKDIFQILILNGQTTRESLNNTLVFQLNSYKQKELSQAVLVMDHLSKYVTGELKESQFQIIQQLLLGKALKAKTEVARADSQNETT